MTQRTTEKHRGSRVPMVRAGVLCLGFALAVACRAQPSACPPEGGSIEAMRAVKLGGWKVDDVVQRQQMALDWLACLASPEPELRDSLGFEGLSAWLRAGGMSIATVRTIGERMLVQLAKPDDAGFAQPFAALALAEVARVDRLKPIWTSEERQAVVEAGCRFMREVRDYRGFDAQAGWRHPVAHGADLMMQLSLNPQLTRPQLDRLLEAVAMQVLPPGEHFYIYGEGERLAAPMLFVARRNLHTEAEWSAWFDRLAKAAAPQPGAPATQASLARLHNAKAFLLPLYASLQEAPASEWRQRMLPGVLAALRAVP